MELLEYGLVGGFLETARFFKLRIGFGGFAYLIAVPAFFAVLRPPRLAG